MLTNAACMPGQHALDAAFVDVSGDPALALPLDVELAEVTVFDERDPGFGAVGVDDQEAVRHTAGYEKLRADRAHADANVRVHGCSFENNRLV